MSKEVLRSYLASKSLTPGGIYQLTKVRWEDVNDSNAVEILAMLKKNMEVIPDNEVILSCVYEYAEMLREQFGDLDIEALLH
jgi:hypothetical protein